MAKSGFLARAGDMGENGPWLPGQSAACLQAIFEGAGGEPAHVVLALSARDSRAVDGEVKIVGGRVGPIRKLDPIRNAIAIKIEVWLGARVHNGAEEMSFPFIRDFFWRKLGWRENPD